MIFQLKKPGYHINKAHPIILFKSAPKAEVMCPELNIIVLLARAFSYSLNMIHYDLLCIDHSLLEAALRSDFVHCFGLRCTAVDLCSWLSIALR